MNNLESESLYQIIVQKCPCLLSVMICQIVIVSPYETQGNYKAYACVFCQLVMIRSISPLIELLDFTLGNG